MSPSARQRRARAPGARRIPDIDKAAADPKGPVVSESRRKIETVVAFAVMVVSVLAVYAPPADEAGAAGFRGADHLVLHIRRMAFALEHLTGPSHALPGWYPRELLGTPFWSNLQNFPFLPTRLLVLALVDPFNALTAGAILAAVLAAALTFLFCRRIGLSPAASAAAGWTFACGGFFAARVLTGHLPLLEAYPSLPLLLLLAECALQARERPGAFARGLVWFGLASACVPLAGHPQLPVYSLVTAGLYVLYRDRGRAGLFMLGAMGLGILVAAFALWPMLLLTTRSTRVLALDPPTNDPAFPYGRILAFFLPWTDGWPWIVARKPHRPFVAYPAAAYFWETVCYVGWAPWLAALILLMHRCWRRERIDRRLTFIFLIGAAAFALSLPAWHAVMASLPGTLLRAPVRQLYVTTFALAVALGAAIDCLIRITPRSSLRTAYVVIGVALIAHGWDLGMHDRAFILPSRRSETLDPATASAIATSLHDGRIAMDYLLVSQWNRRFDDVGFFDSIMLARPYKGLLDLTGNFPWLNVQHMDGSSLTGRALAALGVRFLVTVRERSDLRDVPSRSGVHVYRVPDAADRVAFFPDASAEILSPARIHEQLRDPAFDASRTLLLRGDEATDPQELPAPPSGPAVVSYRRPSPDDVEIDVDAPVPGWVRLIESWDPGWHAEVDGATVPVLAGDDMFIAIRVAAGRHRIRLRFQTPGASTGVAMSIVGILGLAGLAWLAAKGRPIWSRQG